MSEQITRDILILGTGGAGLMFVVFGLNGFLNNVNNLLNNALIESQYILLVEK